MPQTFFFIHYSDIHEFFLLISFFDFPAPTRCCLVGQLGRIRRSRRWLVKMPQTFFFIHNSDIYDFFSLISFFDFPAPTRCCLVVVVGQLGRIRRSRRCLVKMPETFFFIHYSDIYEIFLLISFFDFPAPTRCCLVG